jgi:HD-like signal output (HDOD) protein
VRSEDEVRLVIGDMKSLPTLPSVMGKVLAVLKDERSSASDLEDIIKYDKSLSLKILSFSNAAIYGFPRKITSISEALVVLGLDLVKILALSLPIFDLNQGHPKMTSFLRSLWEHSCNTARVSSEIAVDLKIPMPEGVFLSGLLSDMGRAAFMHLKGSMYLEVLDNAKAGGAEVLRCERDLLGVDHASVSAWIADDFLLPEELVFILKYHHDPVDCPKAKDSSMVVYLAEYILSLENQGASVDGFKCAGHEEVLTYFGLKEEDLAKYVNSSERAQATLFGGLNVA